jgi:hypothetical protein
MSVTTTDIRPVNSTTYVDVAGLQLGLQRLPQEDAGTYLDRLYRATTATRDHTYQGTINEIALNLGLQVRRGLLIESISSGLLIQSSIGGLVLTNGSSVKTFPLMTIDGDTMWKWRMLSDLVSDINSTGWATSTLLIDDAPALTLAKQANVFLALQESISGARVQLEHGHVFPDSLRFNLATPNYGLDATAGMIVFASEPPQGLQVNYQYLETPLYMVVGDVAAFSLLDPNLDAVALTPSHSLVYQLREALQQVLLIDRSYWSK